MLIEYTYSLIHICAAIFFWNMTSSFRASSKYMVISLSWFLPTNALYLAYDMKRMKFEKRRPTSCINTILGKEIALMG